MKLAVETVTKEGKALDWLHELKHAELKWRNTDYRAPQYEIALGEVLDLIKRDYILNAIYALEDAKGDNK